MISPHFSREEFACACGCGFAAVDHELLWVLEDVRTTYGKPVHINSGCRCKEHNARVGGEEDSQHMKGTAADITVEGLSPAKVQQYLTSKYPGRYGIGSYKNFTHIDVRPRMARWAK
jgi:uncharacterized protein YcbK (DUF882 family)